MSRSVFGIDFGTSNIKIYNGITRTTLNEKNIIAIKNKNELFEIGDEAYKMYEKSPENINVIFPIKYGVIADLKSMKMLFEQFYKKMTGPRGSKMGRFCIAVPADITEVEKRAFYDVVAKSDIKAREIKIVEKPIADAVGLGIDMSSARGNMIVNIGADTTEISVISLGGIVVSRIIKLGGNKLDQMICDVVKRKYNILIGLKTAEQIKKTLSDAMYDEDDDGNDDILYVYGRNVITGLPSERGVSKETIYEAIKQFFDDITEAIKNLLERTPPELSADIIDTGIYLTGGSSSIKNLDKLIAKETDLKVNTVNNAQDSVIRGISVIMSDSGFKKLMYEPRESSF
ncbi:rod shape-determining protein [uncultured Eubacterium sp.]|uniref:rod shape-determining protein n=1 Tax=uncultured Eubacterium sp. TaxID=165185 RepID=UPI002673FAFF|nr:rod shape-determining protein [uncultured Eubacterium sp.]